MTELFKKTHLDATNILDKRCIVTKHEVYTQSYLLIPFLFWLLLELSGYSRKSVALISSFSFLQEGGDYNL